MILEGLQRLSAMADLQTYEYIGFGALEFVDFEMIRRGLGISRMTSIEMNSNIERYRFNAPFRSIKVAPGRARDVLPTLKIQGPQIAWLDYESRLTDEVLGDATGLSRRLEPGSVLIVTTNAEPARPESARLNELAKFVGEQRIPLGTTDESLANWGTAAVQAVIMSDEVTVAATRRLDGCRAQLLFNFHYKDDARMQVAGWIVLNAATTRAFDNCHLTDLPFIRLQIGDLPMVVSLQQLTHREVMALNSQLSLEPNGALELPGIDADRLTWYPDFERWYPE